MRGGTARRACTLLFVLANGAAPTAAIAQTPRTGAWKSGVAIGPSYFYGAEGNTVGAQMESSVLRRLDAGRTWLRADAWAHLYAMQPLYPCLLQRGGTCYSASQRALVAIGLGVQRTLIPASPERRGTSYVVLGLATYASSRLARRSPACQPNELCSATQPREQFTDVDGGANVGLGQTWQLGSREMYVESRLHQPIWRQHRDDPYSSYRLFPLTFGLRF